MAMMIPMANTEPRLGREIGERLDALRRAHGWTQGQLVIKTKLDKSTVYQILAGARKDPPVGTVMRFAEAFGVGVDELIGLKPLQMPEPAEPETPQDSQVAERMSSFESGLADTRREMAATNDRLARMSDLLAELLETRAAKAAPRSRGGIQKRAS